MQARLVTRTRWRLLLNRDVHEWWSAYVYYEAASVRGTAVLQLSLGEHIGTKEQAKRPAAYRGSKRHLLSPQVRPTCQNFTDPVHIHVICCTWSWSICCGLEFPRLQLVFFSPSPENSLCSLLSVHLKMNYLCKQICAHTHSAVAL